MQYKFGSRFAALRNGKRTVALLGLVGVFWPLQVGSAQVVPSAAPITEAGFHQYLTEVRARGAAQGVSAATLDRVLPGLSLNMKAIQLDRGQPETQVNKPPPDFAPYKARHVDTARINRGRAKYAELRPMLARIETETGVPESMMLGIYGHETNYGLVTGNFHAPEVLASLAYEGRRRSLFEGELIAVLKMIDRGVPQSAIIGSYAGALGKPQFLPSVYLRLARDADGNGFADIWTSEVDAMASIANYFVSSGWRRGEPWGFAVSTPSGLDRSAITAKTVPTRCPKVFARHSQWKSIDDWRKLGITSNSGVWPSKTMQAVLIEPDGPGNGGYLLGSNYRVILDYNCSNFYALSVGLLSDAIAK